MIYKDPIHKVLSKLNESENVNPGNLQIGQTVDVLVTDAAGAQFVRQMEVTLFYPGGDVLLKDTETQDSIVLQYQWNETGNLEYAATTQFGVSYNLHIDRSRLSSQSRLTESIGRLNEAASLKPFTTYDWHCYGGASLDPDGNEPRIAVGKNADLIVSAESETTNNSYIQVTYGNVDGMAKSYRTFSEALKDASGYLGILDKEDEEIEKFLKSKGFQKIY